MLQSNILFYVIVTIDYLYKLRNSLQIEELKEIFYNFYLANYINDEYLEEIALLQNYVEKFESLLYTPFGEMWVEEVSTVDISHITRFFTNQQYDKESGLYYYNARYYDPHLGSFITPDPAMDGFNHYAYCNANPIMYTDPTGKFALAIAGGSLAAIGAVISTVATVAAYIVVGAVIGACIYLAVSKTIGAIENYNSSKGEKNRERAWERSQAKKAEKEYSNKPDFKNNKPDPNKPDPKNIKGPIGAIIVISSAVAQLYNNKKKAEEQFDPNKLEKDDKPILENQDKEKDVKEELENELDLINEKVKGQIENDVNDDTYSNNPDNQPQKPNLTPNNNTPNNTQDNSGNSGNTGGSSGGSSTSSSSSGTVICTELFRQGLLDIITYNADAKFGEFIRAKYPFVMKGYHYLAKPIVNKMKASQDFTNLIYKFAKPWADEMAYQMNITEKGNFTGKVIMSVGIVLCGLIGLIISIPYYNYIIIFLAIIYILSILVIRKRELNKFKS